MGGVAEPSGGLLAGIALPGTLTADQVRQAMGFLEMNPDDPEQVRQFLAQAASAPTEAKPGGRVLWRRTHSDLDARAREAGGANADVYDPYWIGEGEARAARQGAGADEVMDTDAAKLDILRWDDTKLSDFADKLVAAHLLDPDDRDDRDAVEGMWGKLVDKSARYYDAKIDMTPFDIIDIYAKDAKKAGADGAGGTPKPTQVVSRSVRLADSNQAWGLLRSMLRSELGRDPSDGEVDDFQAALNEAQRAAPTVTTSTYATDAAGNQTQDSVVTGGVDEQSFTGKYATGGGFEKEHRAYQAATTYANAMMQAIQAPV